ncbi:MAG TPA: superoxide dismutase family protein [Bacillales bacterium]|nr:superoxide dismutase family protein [Bacillales bacterium]
MMKKFALPSIILIVGLLLLAVVFLPDNFIGAAKDSGAKDNKNVVSFPAPSTYNYSYTYFTSNGKQHKFITTYLELYNTKGDVIGVAGLVQMGKQVIVKVNAGGLTPGKHGFHIHENPITNGDFTTAGGHFNPTGKQHGHDNPKGAHLGDIQNLVVDQDGKVDQAIVLDGLSLDQGVNNSILGKSLIIHAKEDDGITEPAGNSGDRVAGGNIPQ